jgi:hypothetical protein
VRLSVSHATLLWLLFAVTPLIVAAGPTLPSTPNFPFAAPHNPAYWADRLDFSPEQYEAMARLKKSTGVTQCNELEQNIMRKYGVNENRGDIKAFEAAMKEWSPHASRCDLNGGKFWKAFPDLMTPDQRATFYREMPGLRR